MGYSFSNFMFTAMFVVGIYHGTTYLITEYSGITMTMGNNCNRINIFPVYKYIYTLSISRFPSNI